MSDIYLTPGECCCEPTCCDPCDLPDTLTVTISGITSGECVAHSDPLVEEKFKATADGINAMWTVTKTSTNTWTYAGTYNEIASQACWWTTADCSGEDEGCSPTGEGETGELVDITVTCDAGLFTVTFTIGWGGFAPSLDWPTQGSGNYGVAIGLTETAGTDVPGILTGGTATIS